MINDEAILAEVPLFSLLDSEERRTLAELLNTVHVARGDAIFAYGDPGDSLYIIRRGKVQIFMEDMGGRRIVLAENGPSDLFGEISLLDGGPRTASAVAIEPTEVLMLDREDLLEFVTKRPSAALSLLTVMGQRLRGTNELLRMHASRNVNKEEAEHLTFGRYLTDRVIGSVGSWVFAFVLVGAVVGWLAANVSHPASAFDRPPFPLLGLGLTALVALQATFIMMAQNRQMDKNRLQADLDYEFNLKTELEVAQLSSDVTQIREHLLAQSAEREREDELNVLSRPTPVDRG